MKPVKFKMLSDTTLIPERSSSGAAGYDIYADQSGFIVGGGRLAVSTGWAMEMPTGYYAEIRPRSGLAVKHGIDTLAGVIDSDYRGEVKVVLINHGDSTFIIKAGDRVAQLVFRRHETPNIMLVDELRDSVRGSGGFGSTGV
tara:strand:- start:2250 stop:2675 length:426 start_codon:yes stop_codon:yes gene_type:complete